MISLDNKIILNGQNNTRHILKKKRLPSLNKDRIRSQIQINHFMLCVTLQFLESLFTIAQSTIKLKLISTNSRFFTQAEIRFSTLMRECTAILYTLTKYENLVFGSKHPTVLFLVHKTKFSYLHKNQIQTTEFGGFNYF